MLARSAQWSRWSASTLVTTATRGVMARKDPSDSSASTTKCGPVPQCALVPEDCSSLPIAKDGSSPQACSATVTIEVVVVLPWVPAMAMGWRPAITALSASARVHTGSPRRRASTTSGFVGGIAVDATTTDAGGSPSRHSIPWPTCTCAPSARSAESRRDSFASLPETGTPCASMSRASADMPAPPMPMRCTRVTPSSEGAIRSPLPRAPCRPGARLRRVRRAPTPRGPFLQAAADRRRGAAPGRAGHRA